MNRLDRPEYASYRALMVDQRLPRRFEHGDLYMLRRRPIGSPPEWFEVMVWESSEPSDTDDWRDPVATDEDVVWLPQLHDWVEMLEEAGVAGVLIHRAGSGIGVRPDPPEFTEPHIYGVPTREEACARLWLAVVGHEAAQHS